MTSTVTTDDAKLAKDEPSTAGAPSSTSLPLMALNDSKAGMAGLDTDKINAIIEEASKGSKFYAAKAKSQERISSQVDKMRRSLARLSEAEVRRATAAMDAAVAELRAGRELGRTIVHVDMDAYYAAVEMRDDPDLRTRPMAVGGLGMISTSNYLARKFGVRAGMPGFIGKKLCPELVLVKPNFDKYRADSEIIRGVFREYDPNFSAMSLDEAYLDITEFLRGVPDKTAEETVQEIRQKIQERTQLTASAGIAPNTLLAKICSDQNKPNGQFRLLPNEADVMTFVEKLPIRKVSGIGNVTEQLLRAVGVQNCKDLFEKRGYLKLLFSEISSTSFLQISLGIGSIRLSDWSDRERKSLSTETTFRDTSNPEELFDICRGLCSTLAEDLEKEGLQGRSLTLKIKTHTFKNKSKVANLLDFTCSSDIIEASAKSVLRSFMETAEEKPLKLRLMGVRMSEFQHEESFLDGGIKQTRLEAFLVSAVPGKKEQMIAANAFPCPICFQNVSAASELTFNSHLDICLEKERRDEKTKEAAACKEASLQKHDDDIARRTEVASESDIVTCPICLKILDGTNVVLINRHVDECLGEGPGIKRKLKKEENNSGKNVKKSKHSSITSYFQVIKSD